MPAIVAHLYVLVAVHVVGSVVGFRFATGSIDQLFPAAVLALSAVQISWLVHAMIYLRRVAPTGAKKPGGTGLWVICAASYVPIFYGMTGLWLALNMYEPDVIDFGPYVAVAAPGVFFGVLATWNVARALSIASRREDGAQTLRPELLFLALLYVVVAFPVVIKTLRRTEPPAAY